MLQQFFHKPLRIEGLEVFDTFAEADEAGGDAEFLLDGDENAAFAAAVGLCLFAAHPQDEWWDFDIPSERIPARSLKRAIRWFRDNW